MTSPLVGAVLMIMGAAAYATGSAGNARLAHRVARSAMVIGGLWVGFSLREHGNFLRNCATDLVVLMLLASWWQGRVLIEILLAPVAALAALFSGLEAESDQLIVEALLAVPLCSALVVVVVVGVRRFEAAALADEDTAGAAQEGGEPGGGSWHIKRAG